MNETETKTVQVQWEWEEEFSNPYSRIGDGRYTLFNVLVEASEYDGVMLITNITILGYEMDIPSDQATRDFKLFMIGEADWDDL